jgi:hypothetical protein
MKRFVIGSIAFFAAFFVGAWLAWILIAPLHPLGEADSNGVPAIVVNESPPQPVSEEPTLNSIEEKFIETFTDEKRIGRKGGNKVEVRCFTRGEHDVAEIRFYSKKQSPDWQLRQTFKFERDYAPPCDPEIKDFNNDGLNDLTYWSDSTGRGANEMRTLLVYDKSDDNLVHIRNSNEYPNLEYNAKLDCLTAMHFHGQTSTTFLRIVGDELIHFATVTTGDELVVDVMDTKGQWREVSRKKMRLDDIFTRYSTFDPPMP